LATRLGLVSDVHASPEPLAAALDLFAREGVERVLCAGDIAGYGDALDATIDLLRGAGVETIHGNHDRWFLEAQGVATRASRDWLSELPAVLEEEVEGRRLYCVHASPPQSLMDGIRLLDESGAMDTAARAGWTARLAGLDADLLVVGHTHQLFAECLGETLVVNPGSTLFNRSCAIVDLPSLEVRLLALPGETARVVWDWRGGWKQT
jgi:putative phosphoesterase